jgi:hypothetical protein
MQNRTQLSLRIAIALSGVLALGALAQAQTGTFRRSALEREHLAETRARYAQPLWAQGAARRGLREVSFAGWSSGALRSDQGLLTRAFQNGAGGQASPSFVLETCVADTAGEAHELLVGWLAGVQSSVKAPSTAEAGLTVGEIGFVGRSGAGPGALSWIAFVRGNVAVRVSACDYAQALDLGAVASAVDLAIQQESVLEEGVVPAKPRIDALSLPRSTAIAGDVLRIQVAVADPAAGEPHLQWTVGGPGQGYVEKDVHGDWQLHTTGPGAITLSVEATASTGTWARGEVAVTVLDD